MLIGKSYHSVDAQRRVTIPKSMRASLGEDPILTRGLDGGVFLFPQPQWLSLVKNLENQPFTKRQTRDFLRLISNEAYPVSIDSLGRMTLPESLSQLAQLTKDVVVVGSLQYAEIWDRDIYHEYLDQLENKAEEIAENLPWKEEHAHTSFA